ncbi:MAG: response regulator transcription factor [Chitinophagaceae bacterium]|nr:response regulator transcription factor [Chitinophagaceae bacterium]
MLRTIFVDDEPFSVILLEGLAERYCPEIKNIGTASTVSEAIDLCIKLKPDLMFLDIEIHDENGFDVMEAISDIPVMVVMVTAYEHYALRAIKRSVIDYVLKPVRISEFRDAVAKAAKLKAEREAGISQVQEDVKDHYLALPHGNKMVITNIQQIVRLEGLSNYSRIYTVEKTMHITARTLKEYEDKLPADMFMRIHKSHIINIHYADKILKSKNGSLLMKDGTEIPIAAGRKKMLQEKIMF